MKAVNFYFILFLLCFLISTHSYAQQATGYGGWRLYYFMDEFEDLMYDKPFLETKVKNSKGEVLTIALTNRIDSGEDVVSLGIGDGYSEMTLDRNASVSFKTSDGKVYRYSVPDSHLAGGQIFLRNQKELSEIGVIFHNGDFKIAISSHWAGDTYVSPNRTWTFKVTNQTKGLGNAYKKYLLR